MLRRFLASIQSISSSVDLFMFKSAVPAATVMVVFQDPDPYFCIVLLKPLNGRLRCFRVWKTCSGCLINRFS